MDRADQLYALLHNGKPPAPDMDAESRAYYLQVAQMFDATGPHGVVQLSGHSLRVMFDQSQVTLRLVCHETGRASCRLVCSQGCEQGDQEHEHELVEIDNCDAMLWIGTDVEEYYRAIAPNTAETPFPIYDGMPVTVTWDGDTYVWAPVPTEIKELRESV
jgi:hypothetical protein